MRAVIFDFDGVIVDSEPMHERAIHAAFAAEGFPAEWPEWRRYMGLGDREAFKLILEDNGHPPMTPPVFDRLRVAKSRQIESLISAGYAKPFPGSVELVRAAASAYPTAVCSGSRPHEVRPILLALGVEGLLRAIVTADDVARTKPDPAPYLLAAERLGVPPRDCLAIEDTPVGVRAAVAAGCAVLGLEHTNPAAALTTVGAHSVAIAALGLDLGSLETAWRKASGR